MDGKKMFEKYVYDKGFKSKGIQRSLKMQPTQKLGKRSEQTPHQRRSVNGKWAYEKMLHLVCF